MKNLRNAAKYGSSVRKCRCKSDFQDKKYGNGKRLHNVTTKGWRCTVCDIEKFV